MVLTAVRRELFGNDSHSPAVSNCSLSLVLVMCTVVAVVFVCLVCEHDIVLEAMPLFGPAVLSPRLRLDSLGSMSVMVRVLWLLVCASQLASRPKGRHHLSTVNHHHEILTWTHRSWVGALWDHLLTSMHHDVAIHVPLVDL